MDDEAEVTADIDEEVRRQETASCWKHVSGMGLSSWPCQCSHACRRVQTGCAVWSACETGPCCPFLCKFIAIGGAACVQAAATYSSDEETYASTMARTDQTGEALQRMPEAGAAPQTKVRPVQCAAQAESPRTQPFHTGAITGLLTLPQQGRCMPAVSVRLAHAIDIAPRGELH